MCSLKKKVTEHDASGTFRFSSELTETSYDIGLIWNFF
jgi:hypothetical protein